MIIHPDGRLEGTPEELAAYQKAMQAAPVVIEKPVPVYIPQPYTAPVWPHRPWETWCGTGTMTYSGPDLEVRN